MVSEDSQPAIKNNKKLEKFAKQESKWTKLIKDTGYKSHNSGQACKIILLDGLEFECKVNVSKLSFLLIVTIFSS